MAFSVLARMEVYQLRAFWRAARRDAVFLLAMASIGAVAVAMIHRAAAMLIAAPAIGLFASIALGGLAARLVFPRGGGRAREALVAGPLHLLVCEPQDMAAWLLARSLVALAAIDLFAAVGVATVSRPGALLWLIAFGLGAVVWSALEARQAAREPSAAEAGGDEPKVVGVGRNSPSSALLILLRLVLLGRVRGLPSWAAVVATLVLGALSAALAAHNNDSPALGLGLAIAAATLASALLIPSGALIPLLRREPISLPKLYAWLYGPALAAGGLGGGLIVLAAGLGPTMAGEAALSVLVFFLVLSGLLFLHQLTRSPRLAPASLGADLFGGVILGGIEMSLTFLWLAGRGGWLVHRARRVRWLDS